MTSMNELELHMRSDGIVPLSLWVGVTGHRTLPFGEVLAAKVDAVLTELRQSLANTPVLMSVVSSLAEGADRLVASRILADPLSKLTAVLPFSPEHFKDDFETGASKDDFDRLLARDPDWRVVSSTGREDAYLQAGFQVVDRCDVLIALWDGEPSRGEGGTADIVDRAVNRKLPVHWISTLAPYRHKVIGGDASSAVLQRLDEYNSGSVEREKLHDGCLRLGIPLLEKGRNAGLKDRHMAPFLEWGLPYYVRAEMLAERYRRWHLHLGDSLFVLGALAVASVAAQALFFSDRPALAWVEVAWLMLILVAFAVGRSQRLHARWLSCRHLAERFRSAMFLAIAGAVGGPERIGKASDERISIIDPAREWPRRAFEGALQSCPPQLRRPGRPELTRFLATAWIQDQIDYHEDRRARHWRGHEWVAFLSAGLFLVTLVVAVVHATSRDVGPHSTLTDALVFLAIGLPTAAGALAAIGAQREFRRNSERSGRVAKDLSAIKNRLEGASDEVRFRAAVTAAKDVMLGENRDWIDAMRYHELELHG
jgi:hypothetical protein